MRRALRSSGFESNIFAELIGAGLRRDARPAGELEACVRPGDCVIYHLSIGSPLAELVRRLRCRRAIYFHNITPAEFYVGINAVVTYWLRRGREDLASLAPLVDLSMAPSHYSLTELDAAGSRMSRLVGLPISFDRFGKRGTSRPRTPPAVLFVGRIAPNKRQDELIRYLAAVRDLGGPAVHLRLVGSNADTDRYMLGLRQLAAELGVSSSISFQGQLTDAELADAYSSASMFACASVHEGFCVPLVEAMSFGVPVIARRAGAVPETLGGAGLLLDTDDPIVWASSILRVLDDSPLRATLSRAARRRASDFTGGQAAAELTQSLAAASVEPDGSHSPPSR